MEWSSLVSVVFSFIASCREVLCVSNTLAESRMGSLLFHFGLWRKDCVRIVAVITTITS